MKMIAVLINGISLSGKDTLVNYVKDEVYRKGHRLKVANVSTIDPIKEIYAGFFGWNGVKTDKDRKNLNTLKNIWVEVSNGPVNHVESILRRINKNNSVNVVFIMVREYSEMLALRNMVVSNKWSVYTLCVERDGLPIPPVEQEFLDGHPPNFRYDIYVKNPTVSTYPNVPELRKFSEFFCNVMVSFGER